MEENCILGRGEYSKYSENMKELKPFSPRITPVCFQGAYTRLLAVALALYFLIFFYKSEMLK